MNWILLLPLNVLPISQPLLYLNVFPISHLLLPINVLLISDLQQPLNVLPISHLLLPLNVLPISHCCCCYQIYFRLFIQIYSSYSYSTQKHQKWKQSSMINNKMKKKKFNAPSDENSTNQKKAVFRNTKAKQRRKKTIRPRDGNARIKKSLWRKRNVL